MSRANETPQVRGEQHAKRVEMYTARWWIGRLISPFLCIVAGLVVIAMVGVAQRAGWISASGPAAVATNESAVVQTCPMHPQIRQPNPGHCPICGMELVPAAASESNDLDELSVEIEPAQRRLANIETAEVKYEPVVATISTIGAIAIDESRMATIASYIDGRIERLFADYTGVRVAKHDHLAVIYSPELYSAQVEYLENRKSISGRATALQTVRQAQQTFVANSRRKLQELGLSEDQIQTLETSGKANSRQTIFSPMGGTVIEKLAVEGKYVKAGEPIYRIANLSSVWLKLELYPEDASRIRFGQRVEARVTSLPDQVFEGRVAFVDPTVDPKKRSVGVRVEFLNEGGKMRPGDYADATILLPIGPRGDIYDAELAGKWISPMHPQIIRDSPGECPICGMDLVSTSRYGYTGEPVDQPASLYVPRSALLMAGKNSVVYVEAEPGRFEIRPVTMGPLLKDKAIILDGLRQGEQVATSGNFLIDSQMQLAGKPSLIDPTRAFAKRVERNEPLTAPRSTIASVVGVVGEKLEALFGAYFRIHQTLANDEAPGDDDAEALHRLATTLAKSDELPQEAYAELEVIAKHSQHLSHLELARTRLEAFRPISHSIIRLASLVRGTESPRPFHQMFCPMVKGGSGDWLQADKKLRNPYWGSQMLTCGEVVRSLPSTADEPDASTHEATHSGHELHEVQP